MYIYVYNTHTHILTYIRTYIYIYIYICIWELTAPMCANNQIKSIQSNLEYCSGVLCIAMCANKYINQRKMLFQNVVVVFRSTSTQYYLFVWYK